MKNDTHPCEAYLLRGTVETVEISDWKTHEQIAWDFYHESGDPASKLLLAFALEGGLSPGYSWVKMGKRFDIKGENVSLSEFAKALVEEALSELKGKESSDPWVNHYLGLCYLYGIGIENNEQRACECFHSAISLNNTYSEYEAVWGEYFSQEISPLVAIQRFNFLINLEHPLKEFAQASKHALQSLLQGPPATLASAGHLCWVDENHRLVHSTHYFHNKAKQHIQEEIAQILRTNAEATKQQPGLLAQVICCLINPEDFPLTNLKQASLEEIDKILSWDANYLLETGEIGDLLKKEKTRRKRSSAGGKKSTLAPILKELDFPGLQSALCTHLPQVLKQIDKQTPTGESVYAFALEINVEQPEWTFKWQLEKGCYHSSEFTHSSNLKPSKTLDELWKKHNDLLCDDNELEEDKHEELLEKYQARAILACAKALERCYDRFLDIESRHKDFVYFVAPWPCETEDEFKAIKRTVSLPKIKRLMGDDFADFL